MTTRCQQFEVYDAEEAVPRGTVFRTAKEAQAFMDDLTETWWWQKFYATPNPLLFGRTAPARVEVYFRSRGHSVNKYDKSKDGAVIELRPGQRDAKTLTHELAHIIAEALFDSHAHDPKFARTYAILVYEVLGSQAWLTLQAGYDRCGVDYQQSRRSQ